MEQRCWRAKRGTAVGASAWRSSGGGCCRTERGREGQRRRTDRRRRLFAEEQRAGFCRAEGGTAPARGRRSSGAGAGCCRVEGWAATAAAVWREEGREGQLRRAEGGAATPAHRGKRSSGAGACRGGGGDAWISSGWCGADGETRGPALAVWTECVAVWTEACNACLAQPEAQVLREALMWPTSLLVLALPTPPLYTLFY